MTAGVVEVVGLKAVKLVGGLLTAPPVTHHRVNLDFILDRRPIGIVHDPQDLAGPANQGVFSLALEVPVVVVPQLVQIIEQTKPLRMRPVRIAGVWAVVRQRLPHEDADHLAMLVDIRLRRQARGDRRVEHHLIEVQTVKHVVGDCGVCDGGRVELAHKDSKLAHRSSPLKVIPVIKRQSESQDYALTSQKQDWIISARNLPDLGFHRHDCIVVCRTVRYEQNLVQLVTPL